MKKFIKLLTCAFVALLSLSGCSASSNLEFETSLKNLHYENYENQNLEFTLLDDTDKVITVKGDKHSCGDRTIEDINALKLYVNFDNLNVGNSQEFPIYIKYNDSVCNFEINPETVSFDVKLKE